MKFFIPLYYSFLTRVKKIETKISYIFIVLVPNFYLYFLMLKSKNQNLNLLIFFISFLILNLIYEVGYIYNDVYTVQYEKDPTIRLNLEDNTKLKKLYPLMISFRFTIVGIGINIIKYLDKDLNIFLFMGMLLGLYVVYSLHNYYRGIINIFTMFLLIIFKYLSIPLLFLKEKRDINLLLLFILTLPLARAILYLVHDRAKIKVNYKSKELVIGIKKEKITEFRIIFYGIEIIIGIMLYFIFGIRELCIYSTYFFIFYTGYLFYKKLKEKKF